MTQKVDRTLTIAASPARVWQAFVNDINAWWTAPYYNDSQRVTGLRFEPQVGGRFVEQWGGEAGFLIGHVVEWLPGERLSYTWSERGWGGVVTLVTLTFTPDAAGGTRLSFVHSGFERLPDGAKQRDGYEYGWNELAERLKKYVETGAV